MQGAGPGGGGWIRCTHKHRGNMLTEQCNAAFSPVTTHVHVPKNYQFNIEPFSDGFHKF